MLQQKSQDCFRLLAPVLCGKGRSPGPTIDGVWIHLPCSDLSACLRDEDILMRAHDQFRVERLDGIGQLGLISNFGNECRIIPSLVRREHVLITAIVIGAILRNNRCSRETVTLGEIAGLAHDVGMPAGGDAVKGLDPKLLDEEIHWAENLLPSANKFLAELGISKEAIHAIVCNEGVLGKVLDIADRIAYTLTDSLHIGLQSRGARRDLGNIYHDIHVDFARQELSFLDPERLEDFLRFRSGLFADIYHHPLNQGRDAIIRELVRPFYSPTEGSKITPTLLRQMTDEQLYSVVADQYGVNYLTLRQWLRDQHVQYEKFGSPDKAEERFNQCTKNSELLVARYSLKGFEHGGSYLVHDGKRLAPIGDMMPHLQAELEERRSSATGHYVVWAGAPSWLTNGGKQQDSCLRASIRRALPLRGVYPPRDRREPYSSNDV